AGLGDGLARGAVELGQARPRCTQVDDGGVHIHHLLLELGVLRAQLARTDVLRVVAPVAVRTYPDLEERRLALDDWAIAGGGERLDPGARPDERERERQVDEALPAGPLAVHEPLP